MQSVGVLRKKTRLMPERIYGFGDAAALAGNWPGVRRARYVSILTGDAMRDVIEVSFWPWTRNKRKVCLALAGEISTRFVEQPAPRISIMRDRAVRRLLALNKENG